MLKKAVPEPVCAAIWNIAVWKFLIATTDFCNSP
jgi:hypothetical protein